MLSHLEENKLIYEYINYAENIGERLVLGDDSLISNAINKSPLSKMFFEYFVKYTGYNVEPTKVLYNGGEFYSINEVDMYKTYYEKFCICLYHIRVSLALDLKKLPCLKDDILYRDVDNVDNETIEMIISCMNEFDIDTTVLAKYIMVRGLDTELKLMCAIFFDIISIYAEYISSLNYIDNTENLVDKSNTNGYSSFNQYNRMLYGNNNRKKPKKEGMY